MWRNAFSYDSTEQIRRKAQNQSYIFRPVAETQRKRKHCMHSVYYELVVVHFTTACHEDSEPFRALVVIFSFQAVH